MCMYDDCEQSQLLREDDRKARKEHRCCECARVIFVGETYHLDVTMYDGRLSTYKTCAHCMVARKWLSEECGGWIYTAVEEDIGEHVRELRRNDLARLYVSMRRNWRTFRGKLMLVPAMPEVTP